MPLESFPPGFILKSQAAKVMEEPVEPPVEEPEVPEETPVKPTPEPEPEPEPLPAPPTPTSTKVETFNTSTKIKASWVYQEIAGITFALFFDGEQHSTVMEQTSVYIDNLAIGSHTFQVKAFNSEGTASEMTQPITFTVSEPAGINNANYWLPSRIDNIAVTYRK